MFCTKPTAISYLVPDAAYLENDGSNICAM
jgi:hypothetical protein